jgi:hypothetical protein
MHSIRIEKELVAEIDVSYLRSSALLVCRIVSRRHDFPNKGGHGANARIPNVSVSSATSVSSAFGFVFSVPPCLRGDYCFVCGYAAPGSFAANNVFASGKVNRLRGAKHGLRRQNRISSR